MEKSIYSAEYTLLLRKLRDARKQSGMTQQELAQKLRQTQSFISKCERGERRLDVVELRRWCSAIRVPFADFCRDFEKSLRNKGRR